MKVAFASINGKQLDCSFRECPSFSVFEFTERGYKWIESRAVPKPAGEDDDPIGCRMRLIADCKLLFVRSMENEVAQKLMKAKVFPLFSQSEADIMTQLEEMLSMARLRPPLWLTKALRCSEEEEKGNS